MNYLKQTGIALITTVLCMAAVYYLMPFEPLKILDETDMLGATITTIAGTDKIKDSRAVINTNFDNLNADKLEVGIYYATTTHAVITSIPNLATIGTITSGTWNGTTLTVAYGGTGSTTLLSNAVLLGNGTSSILAVPAGTEDQVLTLKSGVPTWDSTAVDETANYSWTGWHEFDHIGMVSATATAFTATALTADAITMTATSTAYMGVVGKGYVDGRTAISGLASAFSNNGAGWATTSLSTSGEASLLHFVVNIQENEQNGGNSTKIRVYDIWFDIADQTYSILTLYTTDAGNDETCGITAAGGDDDYVYTGIGSYTVNSSFRVEDEGGSGDSYFGAITSDENSIDITTYSSADGCISVGTIFYW